MSDDDPGLISRIVAYFRREVSAERLEPYRRAGRIVQDLADRVGQLETQAYVEHDDRWHYPANLQAALLCASNAAALQLLADRLIEADFELDPLTSGFVDRATLDQAATFYGQVPRWVSRAEQALHNPGYRLDVEVPAPLPEWPAMATEAEVRALLAAADALTTRTEPSLDKRARQLVARRRPGGERILELLAEGRAALAYSHGAAGGGMADEPRSELAVQVRCAIERYYLAGQLVAMPGLASGSVKSARLTRAKPGAAPLLPAPHEPGFDPWCLTDPRAAAALRKDDDKRRSVRRLWQSDPDPRRTLAIKRQLDSALYRGDIAIEAGHFSDCPWSPIYLVKRTVRIGNRTWHPLEQVTFVVGWTEGLLRARFRRQIISGPFYP